MAFVARSRKSGYTLRSSGPQRTSVWIFIATVEASLTGSPTAVLGGSLNAAALALRPFTIVRNRGIFQARSDQSVGTESFGADLGFCVVSEQAEAIGITAVPTPLTDKGSDLFFVYEQLFSTINVGSGVGTGVATMGGSVYKDWDSKAMRKVNEDEQVIFTLENEIAGAIAIVSGRMLVKLH